MQMECCVCLERFGEVDQRIECRLPCTHSVCLHCLVAGPLQACPLCRQPLRRALPPALQRTDSARLDILSPEEFPPLAS
mgnify:FL=1|jgi:hypothetical protein